MSKENPPPCKKIPPNNWSRAPMLFSSLIRKFSCIVFQNVLVTGAWKSIYLENFQKMLIAKVPFDKAASYIATLCHFTLTFSASYVSESCIKMKINWNFCFQATFCCLRWFHERLKAFIKSFKAPQRGVKIIFSIQPGLGRKG